MGKKLESTLTLTKITELAFLFESYLNKDNRVPPGFIEKYLNNKKELNIDFKSTRSKFEKFLKGLCHKKFGTFTFFEYEKDKEYSSSEGAFIIMLCIVKDLNSFKSLNNCKPFNPSKIERDIIQKRIDSIRTLDKEETALTNTFLAIQEFLKQYEDLIMNFNENWKDTLGDIVNVLAESSTKNSKDLLNILENMKFKHNISINHFVQALNRNNFQN